jgi:hypothetical protein
MGSVLHELLSLVAKHTKPKVLPPASYVYYQAGRQY